VPESTAAADVPETTEPGAFPPRSLPTVRAGSVAEREAFIRAWPAPAGPWRVTGLVAVGGRLGPEEHVALVAPDGEVAAVRFAVDAAEESATAAPPGQALDALMERAVAWAKEHEATHPGVLPRFPVPAEATGAGGGAARVAGGRRRPATGTLRADTRRDPPLPRGRGRRSDRRAGFDPAAWPPRRLGPWPPPGLAGFDPARLAGTVRRFSALWERLLAAFFAGSDDPNRRDEAAEARLLLARLDPTPMLRVYGEMSPRFWGWVEERADR
jgi:hypothetical protein